VLKAHGHRLILALSLPGKAIHPQIHVSESIKTRSIPDRPLSHKLVEDPTHSLRLGLLRASELEMKSISNFLLPSMATRVCGTIVITGNTLLANVYSRDIRAGVFHFASFSAYSYVAANWFNHKSAWISAMVHHRRNICIVLHWSSHLRETFELTMPMTPKNTSRGLFVKCISLRGLRKRFWLWQEIFTTSPMSIKIDFSNFLECSEAFHELFCRVFGRTSSPQSQHSFLLISHCPQ